ncbi:NAD-dependent epimerase/dehydratase family protein [uncultured Fibrobacter sp.]|jgi:Nucleoside-diphosphate-sugar epimerases|uniref:NAD-dependent epimerase/dehydratase family protein n=1 Tax=uncultured Fibrobacter sp. TaxID=261512 RepID=UPI0025EFBA32|nr:NAD-dependent epimerase/dehydratase family protein [uncultured Fibrobacter sp.]
MKILVTGAAGFIASKIMAMLALRGDEVVGLDNINDYYDVRLKYGRLWENGFRTESGDALAEMPFGKMLESSVLPGARFVRMDIADKASIDKLFAEEKFDKVVHLAAQAGVRYSITNPYAYMQSNMVGFLNILEACRHNQVKHLLFASSSSVYGLNSKVPYSEDDKVDNPVSLYAASKKSNELMAHAYSKLYGIPVTGLRYFTVYGPWGRPDMSPMLFARAISKGEPIKVFNNGDMIRDFTYIDDIAEGSVHALDHMPVAAACENGVPYKLYNIGCSHPVKLMDFIAEIEAAYGESAKKDFLPMQPGDVYQTNADTTKLETECGYKPHWSLHDGIAEFMKWYKSERNPLRGI